MSRNRIRHLTDTCVSARLETKLGIAFSTLAVFMSALLTLVLYVNVRTQLRRDIQQRLHDLVSTAALTIDADAHATLVRPEQEDTPTYARLKTHLQRFRQGATDIHFVYTWRRDPAGRLAFVVDAETDPNELSHIGEVYDSAEPEVLAMLATLNTVTVDDQPNADKWGMWLSGYAPFYRSDGRMEGILGMDINAADVLARERAFLWIALAVFGATVPAILWLGMSFGRRLAAPIYQVTRSAERIAGGDWSHRVEVRGGYEAVRLAYALNRMTDALQNRDAEIDNRKKIESALDALNRNLQWTVSRLKSANDELRSFAAVTSHDLKTPLRGIKMLADWIATDYADRLDDRGRECLALLSARVTRMFKLIEAIHRYVSVGYAKESEEPVDLHALVRRVLSNLSLPDHVSVEIEGHLPIVHCHDKHIAQVFESLLSNATKYADPSNGRVTVRCREEPADWQFSVTDNGPGIDEEYHEKIFEIFQTLETKDLSDNMGIGLSVAKKIVELYDGRIWVHSTPGEGSAFFFTLPKPGVAPTSSAECSADTPLQHA
jgi:signal transduction histidine kinase